MFDKVCGTDEIRRQLKAGKSAWEIVESWKAGEQAFRQQRRKYLIYTDPALTQSASANEFKPVQPVESKPALALEPKPVRTPVVTNSTEASLAPLVITVSKGDTAAKIAQDLGVTVSDLAEANPGTNVSRLKVGQKLKVPRPEAK